MLGAALLLMATIGMSGYVTMGVLEWDENVAAPVVIIGNLLLAWFLIARFGPLQIQPQRARGGVALRPENPADVDQAVFLTEAQKAYLANPAARVSCADLQPVEGLLKQAGVKMYPLTGAEALTADCRIDEAALRRIVNLEPVHYSDYFDDRVGYGASLACGNCRWTIRVRHPELGGVVFPPPGNATSGAPGTASSA